MSDKKYQGNYIPPKPTKLIPMPEIKQAPRKEDNMITAKWIAQAVNAIKSGLAAKLEKDGVTVYKCGKIIRIDIPEDVREEGSELSEAWKKAEEKQKQADKAEDDYYRRLLK